MRLRPWNHLPIVENGEPLQPLPEALQRLQPHPYQALGAPYGAGLDPFRLRQAVIHRLLQAQESLQAGGEGWRLAIFDAWRPVAVQRFMVEHAVRSECRRRGLDPDRSAPGGAGLIGLAAVEPDPYLEVRELVGRFWAAPSEDPAQPPPHSTGGAVDLTLAGPAGNQLAMGGEIDALGPESEPDHYAAAERGSATDAGAGDGPICWHRRRLRLRAAMEAAGFVQHPHEWWHFSYGDQLWAWRSGRRSAVYGRCGC